MASSPYPSFSIADYRGDRLDQRIQKIIESNLNLDDDGEMMMPLKQHEIGSLWDSIRELVEKSVRKAESI